MFLVFSIIHFQESNQILKFFNVMMIIFDFKKQELKEKTQHANFRIPIINPESAIKKQIPDSKICLEIGRIPDFGSGLPTLHCTFYFGALLQGLVEQKIP